LVSTRLIKHTDLNIKILLSQILQKFNKYIIGTTDDMPLNRRVFNIACFFTFVAFGISVIQNISLQLHPYVILQSILGFICYGLFFFIFKNKKEIHTFIFWGFLLLGQILLSFIWFYCGGSHGSIIFFFILFFCVSFLLIPRRTHIVIIVLFIFNIAALYFIEYRNPSLVEAYKTSEDFFLDMFFSIILIIGYIYMILRIVLNNYLSEHNKVLQNNSQLQEKNEQIILQNDQQQLLLKKIQSNEKMLLSHQENLSIINHILRNDIINNLSGINSLIHLYQRKPDKLYLDEISKSVNKSIELIYDMKELEKYVLPDMELTEYSLQEIFIHYKEQYPNYISIKKQGDCKVLSDKSIYPVFDNLIKNTLNHSQTDRIELHYEIIGTYCEVKIIDYGIGIPDDIKNKLFNEGYSYGDSGNSGLGLYIVKKSMDKVGGQVRVENTIPRGSTFILTFKNAFPIPASN